MNYMVCIPSPSQVDRDNCEKIHNILARVAEKYKLKIVPEPEKTKMSSCPDFYKKYRIYKEIKEREGSGEAYLLVHPGCVVYNEEKPAETGNCVGGYHIASLKYIRNTVRRLTENKEKNG